MYNGGAMEEVKTTKRLDEYERAKVIKEAKETGNIALVAKAHGIGYSTLTRWITEERQYPNRKKSLNDKMQAQKLKDLELENMILRDLLKKTNQLWLTDGK